MRSRLVVAGITLAALLAAGRAPAEPLGSHFQLTPIAGYTLFDGAYRYPGTNPLADDLYAGLRASWQSKSWYAIEGAFGTTPTSEDIPGGKDANFWHGSGNLVVSPWKMRSGEPFLFAGGGYGQFNSEGAPDVDMGLLEFGGGVKVWMTDLVGLRFEVRDMQWIRDESSKPGYSHVMVGGGLAFALGATPRDTDGDGVPDKKDKCANTIKGALVDANGCPTDADGDGVFDGIDKCPNTPKGATVDAAGCPSDADGDGVFDGIDKCADTPKGATVDATGCPSDTDGDGVLDGIDQCANTPKGCTVDINGCPVDSDGDGVCDGIDTCPNTPSGVRVDEKGCNVELIERATELMDTGLIRLKSVQFETGKATLLPESYPALDVVGSLLEKWPTLKIEIGGHTDSKGAASANQKLSLARAQSVANYLFQKFPGLKKDQYTVKGYGESKPIAPNTTPEGLATNRRVELKVLNTDVLRREIETRRPAPADSTKK